MGPWIESNLAALRGILRGGNRLDGGSTAESLFTLSAVCSMVSPVVRPVTPYSSAYPA